MLKLIWMQLLIVGALAAKLKLRTMYEWKYVDFEWLSNEQKRTAIENNEYIVKNVWPSDMEIAPDGRVFVSLVGHMGTPARLATVTNVMGPGGPLLRPYPDWSWHKVGDCKGISGVFRTALDECNRLWVLDTGRLEQTNGVICPAQLLAFDLDTDKLVQRIKIPNHISMGRDGKSLLATPIVETEGKYCHKTTVFMAETNGNGLIVWDGVKLVRHMADVFDPVPEAINFIIGNASVVWDDSGPVGMALTPAIFPDEPRYLYFRSLASFDMWAVDTRVITKSTNAQRVKYHGARRILSSQAIGQAFSSEGALFFVLSRETALACFNHYKPLRPDNVEIIEEDPTRLNYVNGVKVVQSRITHKEELWLISNKLVEFFNGTMSMDVVNYRILKAPVRDLIAGTKCDMDPELKTELENIREASRTNCSPYWGKKC